MDITTILFDISKKQIKPMSSVRNEKQALGLGSLSLLCLTVTVTSHYTYSRAGSGKKWINGSLKFNGPESHGTKSCSRDTVDSFK